MWNETVDGGNDHGNGWAGGETSFMTDKKADNKSTQIGDRLPVPATISMLNEHFSAQDDKYVIGHFRFATVVTVGIVKEITEDGNSYNYVICDPDNTDAEFTAVKYSSGGPSFDPSAIVEGTRVRAIGKLKAFDSNNMISLFNIFPLTNDKDQTIFYLEAQAARLFFEKNITDKLRSEHTSNGFTGMLAPPKSRQSSHQNSQNSQASDTRERIYKTEQKPAKQEEGSMADRIRAILNSAPGKGGEGSHINWIAEQLGETNLDKLGKCMADLVDEGYVYSTTDEFSYSAI